MGEIEDNKDILIENHCSHLFHFKDSIGRFTRQIDLENRIIVLCFVFPDLSSLTITIELLEY